MAKYVPAKGDFVALTFTPQSGHEQKGRRPALVISNTLFNEKTGLAIVCPLTNTDQKYPLHVKVPANLSVTGFIMVDQVKSVDYNARKGTFIERAPGDVLAEVLAILAACIF